MTRVLFGGFISRPTYRDIWCEGSRTVVQLGRSMPYLLNGARKRVDDEYVCDGNSYPRILWPILGQPLDGLGLPAGVLHDWHYNIPANHPDKLSRADADELYRQALIWLGMHPVRSWLRYAGVRIGGYFHFNRNSQ